MALCFVKPRRPADFAEDATLGMDKRERVVVNSAVLCRRLGWVGGKFDASRVGELEGWRAGEVGLELRMGRLNEA